MFRKYFLGATIMSLLLAGATFATPGVSGRTLAGQSTPASKMQAKPTSEAQKPAAQKTMNNETAQNTVARNHHHRRHHHRHSRRA